MHKRSWCCLALAGVLTFAGCDRPKDRTVKMELKAVNTANKILVVEGTTDLPAGSKLAAELDGHDGRVFMRDESVVRDGAFYFDFDLDSLSEFSAYKVVVTFDPVRAPLAVRRYTGLWGEALTGAGVEKVSGHKIFRAQKEILLSTSAKGFDWEGRDFETMESPERTRIIDELERYLNEHDDDKIAKLALARAYIAAEPIKEKVVGSRAHQLLVEAARSTASDPNGVLARKLLAEIEVADSVQKKAEKTRRAVAGGSRYRTDFSVKPGQSLGGFRLGAPYEVALRYFKTDRRADFKNSTTDPTITLTDFMGMELTYGKHSRRLVAARTTSPRFQLPEGVGVGSLLQELQRAYGTDVIPTPAFRYQGSTADGKKLYIGVVETDGLDFEITRSVDSEFGIPVDKVTALTVYSRGR